MHTNYKSLDH